MSYLVKRLRVLMTREEIVPERLAGEAVPEVRGGRLLRVEDLGARPAEAPGTR